VPDEVLDRRDKLGYTTPQTRWLSTLAPWVDGVLASEAARHVAPLALPAVEAEWAAVKAGRRPSAAHVWRWVNLIRWAERFGVRFST
ncbi:MAG: asparagine synthase, partial [Cyanobacteria bacterium RYN_339]|nr:asparagine synthase [Cyanobacteria bacterium RYN_339]